MSPRNPTDEGIPVSEYPAVRKTVGGFIENTYSASLRYRGLTFHRTDLGGRGDRTDWVADLPGASLAVSHLHGRGLAASRNGGTGGWGRSGANTFRQEADAEIDRAAFHARFRLAEKAEELEALAHASKVLGSLALVIAADGPGA